MRSDARKRLEATGSPVEPSGYGYQPEVPTVMSSLPTPVPAPADTDDVEALLRIIRDAYLYAIPTHSIVGVPEAVLASDWLAADRAAQRAEARAEVREQIAQAIEAQKRDSHPTVWGYWTIAARIARAGGEQR
jgi:hypothetical protein